jgi:hypothetical protein
VSNDIPFLSALIDCSDSIHSPTRVLGRRLRKFCLWHQLLLKAIDSPFLRKGDVTRFDLRTAVGICRLRFGDSRVRRPITPLLTRRRFQREVLNFLSYAGDYISEPEFVVEESTSSTPVKPRGAPPEPLRVACDVMSYLHVSEVRAWEMPLALAKWYSLMANRAAGAPIDFITTRDKEFQEQMRKKGIAPFDPRQRRVND